MDLPIINVLVLWENIDLRKVLDTPEDARIETTLRCEVYPVGEDLHSLKDHGFLASNISGTQAIKISLINFD